MTKKKFDIIISGAGPAGCTCALALGKSGLKVALIDKSSFPREKVCGGAVAAYVPKVLNTIDKKYAEALKSFTEKTPVNACRIVASNGKFVDIRFSEQGFISKRIDFDNFLFQLASELPNVEVFSETIVQDVTVDDKSVLVKTSNNVSFEAQLIIGCDGVHSTISKKLTKNKTDLKHYTNALRVYYKNVSGATEQTFELHFLKRILPGYLWIFPLPDNTFNVGIGILSNTVVKKKINLRAEMLRAIEEAPTLKERFKDAEMIGEIRGAGLQLGSRKVTISGNRFMLCGDAASLIDPLTGEGIGQAMISGRYAGWQAIKCFKENDFSDRFLKQYDKTVYDKVWSENRKRYMFQLLINKKNWLLNMGIGIASKSRFFKYIMNKMIW